MLRIFVENFWCKLEYYFVSFEKAIDKKKYTNDNNIISFPTKKEKKVWGLLNLLSKTNLEKIYNKFLLLMFNEDKHFCLWKKRNSYFKRNPISGSFLSYHSISLIKPRFLSMHAYIIFYIIILCLPHFFVKTLKLLCWS